MTKQIIENKMCFFLFFQQILSEIYFNITRTERDIIKNVYRPLCKVPVIFVRVEWNLNFRDRILKKNMQIPTFIKIRPVGADLFHVDAWMDRQTDMTKLIVALRNAENAPKSKR